MARTVYIGYSIMNILSDCKIHSIRKIADELQLNKNTIQKHVNELALHYPIFVTLGKFGGVRLAKSFNIGGRYFANNEIELLIQGLRLLESQVTGIEIENLIAKLTPQKKELKNYGIN